jgi:hypothetical protein
MSAAELNGAGVSPIVPSKDVVELPKIRAEGGLVEDIRWIAERRGQSFNATCVYLLRDAVSRARQEIEVEDAASNQQQRPRKK